MTFDSPSAVVSAGVHGVVAWVGTSIFCVVVEQPWWLPLLAALIASAPSLYKVLNDHRLKNALAETERQKRRAEAAEAKLASANVDGAEKSKDIT